MPFPRDELTRTKVKFRTHFMRAKIHRCFSITHMHGLRDLNGMMDTTERAVQTQRLLELSKQVQRWAIGL